MFKRVICFALSIVMMCGMALTTFAAETDAVEENPDADAFFAFVTGPERMDDDGDFTFSFNSILTSESRFTPNNQNLDVWVQNFTVGKIQYGIKILKNGQNTMLW